MTMNVRCSPACIPLLVVTIQTMVSSPMQGISHLFSAARERGESLKASRARFEVAHLPLAPKVRQDYSLGQSEAPPWENRAAIVPALKGRNSRTSFRPYRAWRSRTGQTQGGAALCPGLVCCRTFGAPKRALSKLALRAGILLLLCTATASAQPKVTLAAPKSGGDAAVVPVMAQSARCAAVSDVHGLLAFGHDRGYADAHVSLVRLDARGTPAAYTLPLKLPSPAGLVKMPNYAVSVAFHPKLPLLYVWQDFAGNYTNPPTMTDDMKKFDHLLIYDVSKETPALLAGLCRGPDYIFGQQGGRVSVDPTGSFLYIPCIREEKNAGSLRFGRFPLSADGLPKKEANAQAPLQMTPIEYVNLFHMSSHGSGMSFHHVSKDVVIATCWQGLMTWRPEDKIAPLNGLSLKLAGHARVVGHPTLPVLFASVEHAAHGDSLFRVEHVEGYLTLLPRQYVIPESKLTSPPAILSKQKKVAVGGQYQVYLIDLDDKGFPAGNPTQVQLNCPAVRALVYSERFERLYVGVELSK